jgi:imidazolonepropionase-like amidohydrolase
VSEASLLIKAPVVLTMTGNEPVRHQQGILIENGRIKALDNWSVFGSYVGNLLDVAESTIMPGLIDAHTHVLHGGEPDENWRLSALTDSTAMSTLKAERNAFRHLEHGVTTIRDVGCRDYIDVALRNAISKGVCQGPTMLVAGYGITATGGHMDPRKYVRPGIPLEVLAGIGTVADSTESARQAAWTQMMYGADVLKLNATLSEYVRAQGGQCSPELTLSMMQAICEVAHDTGRKVAAHCHGGPGVRAALEAGVDTLEHGRFLDDELLGQMAEQDTFLVPTLSPEARRVDYQDPPADPATKRWYDMATDVMYRTVARAKQLGVQVVAGTDAGMPYVRHGEVAYEIAQLAHAGLSTLEALVAGTQLAASALGLDDTKGQLKPGFDADLLIVKGNPLEQLDMLQDPAQISAVIQRGRLVIERGSKYTDTVLSS